MEPAQIPGTGSGGGGGSVTQGTTPWVVSGTVTANLATGSNTIGSVEITDGTNTANVAANNTTGGGNAGNPLLIAPTGLTTTYTLNSSSPNTPWIDMLNYPYMSAVFTGNSAGIFCSFATANDTSQAVSSAMYLQSANGSWAFQTNSTTAVYAGPRVGRYFRITSGATGGQTVNISITPFTSAPFNSVLNTQAVSQSGNWNIGSVAISNTGSITTSSSSIVSSGMQNTMGGFIPVTIHGTYAGISFTITVSDDNGTTYYNVPIYDTAANQWLAPGTTITPASNASKLYWVVAPPNNSGTLVKVLASAYTSGTGNIRIGGTASSVFPGSTMSQIMDAAGNNRGANVDANNAILVDAGSATGSAVPTGANYLGGQARSSEQTAGANGNLIGLATDLTGKLINMPYANKENFLSGVATSTGTSAASVIAAQGSGVKIYITRVVLGNTGASTSLVTLQNDPTGTPSTLAYLINPSGGGGQYTFDPPLASAANKAVGWTPATASTTQYITIDAYAGS